MWQKGFVGLDAIHHQAGNYLVQPGKDSAAVHANAIASHYKKAALNGKTREYIGSYDLGLQWQKDGWRINLFKYNLKYMTGNLEMK